MLIGIVVTLVAICLARYLFSGLRAWQRKQPRGFRHCEPALRAHRVRRKPDWVIAELIRLAALMPHAGCRTIAITFNRVHALNRSTTVGKTYVHGILLRHRYEIRDLRRQYNRRVPHPLPVNRVWGMDLAGKGDLRGEQHSIVGIIDHGSRRAVTLDVLRERSSIALLRCLLDAIERCGKPKAVRTDNEPVFASRLFVWGLGFLGIRHQRTEPGCPWMNGRIERLFGTLKEKLDRLVVADGAVLRSMLAEFGVWYNVVRPHQHLGGWTPMEVWEGIDPYRGAPRSVEYFCAWDGLLTGFHIRR